MVLFARTQPDTPGKLAAHAYAYEHMEMAAYELLALVAERAGDRETAEVARSIREQEAAMAERLEDGFDRAVDASLRDVEPADLGEQLDRYLPGRPRDRVAGAPAAGARRPRSPATAICARPSRSTWRRRARSRPRSRRGSRRAGRARRASRARCCASAG